MSPVVTWKYRFSFNTFEGRVYKQLLKSLVFVFVLVLWFNAIFGTYEDI